MKALGSISIRYVYLNSFFTQSTIALNIESNISISPFFRISDITVFLTHDSVMQTTAKPVPQPTTVVTISVVTRAVKPNIFIPPFIVFLFNRILVFFYDLTIIHVMVAAPKASPPIVINKLSIIFPPIFYFKGFSLCLITVYHIKSCRSFTLFFINLIFFY